MALPILRGDESLAVVKRLAELNIGLSGIIEALGKEVLQFPGVGLRTGLLELPRPMKSPLSAPTPPWHSPRSRHHRITVRG